MIWLLCAWKLMVINLDDTLLWALLALQTKKTRRSGISRENASYDCIHMFYFSISFVVFNKIFSFNVFEDKKKFKTNKMHQKFMKIFNMCSALAALSHSLKILISKNLKIHVILMLYGCSCNPSSKRHYDSLRNVSHLPWFLRNLSGSRQNLLSLNSTSSRHRSIT